MNITAPRLAAVLPLVLLLVLLLPALAWGLDAYQQGDNVLRWSVMWSLCR